MAEFYSRLARSLGVPFLPLFALPLALAAKRGRRTPGMIVGAVVLVAFHHSVTLAKSFADSGSVDPLLAIAGIFVLMAGFGVWLFLSSRRRPGETPISGLFLRIEQMFDRRTKAAPTAMRQRGPLGLSAYLTRIMLVRTAAAAAALMALLQLIDLLERTSDILARGGFLQIFRYMALRLPFLFQEVAPFAVLAGAIFTFSQLARNSELVVMRITGLSLFQIFRRTLPVAFAVAAVDLVVADQITPRAEQALATWWVASAPGAHKAQTPRWFRIDNDVVMVKSATPTGEALQGVSIYERDASDALSRRMTAASATHEKGGLAPARRYCHRSWSGAGRHHVRGRHRLANFARPKRCGAAVFHCLRDHLGDRSALSVRQGAGRQESERIQDPALSDGRRGRRTDHHAVAGAACRPRSRPQQSHAPVIFGLGCGLLYLVTDGLLTAMGQVGTLPPLVAAWGAPVGFTAGAVSILLYAEG